MAEIHVYYTHRNEPRMAEVGKMKNRHVRSANRSDWIQEFSKKTFTAKHVFEWCLKIKWNQVAPSAAASISSRNLVKLSISSRSAVAWSSAAATSAVTSSHCSASSSGASSSGTRRKVSCSCSSSHCLLQLSCHSAQDWSSSPWWSSHRHEVSCSTTQHEPEHILDQEVPHNKKLHQIKKTKKQKKSMEGLIGSSGPDPSAPAVPAFPAGHLEPHHYLVKKWLQA